MYYYEVAPTQIIRANASSFTYCSTKRYSIGSIVHIPVGAKKCIGVVVEVVKKPAYDTKSIADVVERTPLPVALIRLATWMSIYYSTPLATVLQSILPRGLTKTRRKTATTLPASPRNRTNFVFTKDQQSAISSILQMSPGTALLHGITGSGKTAVYIELAKRTVAAGDSVIILVPEIALTTQLVADFSHHFPDILLTHSRQTEAERHTVWRQALTSTSPRVVIGPRSALFMPVAQIGLVVIDECHEPSFKQEQSPRYSALRAASELVRAHGAKLVLGSATPLISDYYLAQHADRPIITMRTSAQTDTVKPTLQLIDMTKRSNFSRHPFLSTALLEKIETTLASNHQVLIFHNRRGSASTTLCEQCGWQAGCSQCYIPLTLHTDSHTLRCHLCGRSSTIPTVCPECNHTDIIHKGIGTKRVASELERLFPKARIERFDGDSEATVEKLYKSLYDGSIDIIIGTQIIAKGLDLPQLRTVGVIQADSGLALPDYTASERTFQLLSQVVGRVGRSNHPTDVVVQSYQPNHPAVIDGLSQDYASFYARTLALRQHTHFPPFCFLLKLTCLYKTEAAAIKNAQKLALTLKNALPQRVEILGPTPAFYERAAGTYRWQLVLKSSKRVDLQAALQHLPPTHWQYELDPLSLL
jgi:primosomal protein N' (replication factor Y)